MPPNLQQNKNLLMELKNFGTLWLEIDVKYTGKLSKESIT